MWWHSWSHPDLSPGSGEDASTVIPADAAASVPLGDTSARDECEADEPQPTISWSAQVAEVSRIGRCAC